MISTIVSNKMLLQQYLSSDGMNAIWSTLLQSLLDKMIAVNILAVIVADDVIYFFIFHFFLRCI